MRGAILGFLIVAAVMAGSRRASAQDAIRVTANDARATFAERLDFELTAESASPIVDVVLQYTTGTEGVRNRRIPEFTPGTTVSARHVETPARGQIPPASEITWWWTLTNADGATVDTAPRSLRYLDERFPWRSTAGSDVRVWWYGAPESFAEDLATRARAALADLTATIGTAPASTVHIVAYRDRADMRAALPDRGTVFEERLTTLGSRVAPDILLLLAGEDNPELDAVLRHELSHLVLHEHIGREYLAVPAWLDEGLAMYVEGALAPDEAARLRDALREDTLMSLRSLTTFPGEAELVPLAYAESRDVVAWLLDSYGRERFQALLDTLAEGRQDIDLSLRAVYGLDQLGLYEGYRAKRGLPPPGTPAPRAVAGRTGGARNRLPCAGLALLLPVAVVVLAHARRARRRPPGARLP